MAQADSTPTPLRDPFTGAETERSTDDIGAAEPTLPPHGQLPGKVAYPRRRSADRRYFIGGSDARIAPRDDGHGRAGR
jgi:hypothetical protein